MSLHRRASVEAQSPQGGDMKVKEKLLQVMDWIEAVENRLIESLSAEERARRGEVDHWSPKDILSHVVAWRQTMIQMFQAREPESVFRTMEEVQPANTFIFNAYRDLSWTELEAFARSTRDDLRRLVSVHSEKDLTDPKRFPWLEGQTLWRRIAGNLVVHPLTHYAQLLGEVGRKRESFELQIEGADQLLGLDDDPAWQGVTIYNRACAYALAGQKEPAIADLRRALELNPGLTEWSKEDPDFSSVRKDPAFQAVYAR